MENPYQSPGAVVEDREKPSSSLGDVASGQKLVIYAILLYFLAAALRTVVGPVAVLAFLACLVMSWTGIYKIARGLDYPVWWRIVLLVLMLIPLVGLIELLVLSSKATSRLRKAGYSVGLLGGEGLLDCGPCALTKAEAMFLRSAPMGQTPRRLIRGCARLPARPPVTACVLMQKFA